MKIISKNPEQRTIEIRNQLARNIDDIENWSAVRWAEIMFLRPTSQSIAEIILASIALSVSVFYCFDLWWLGLLTQLLIIGLAEIVWYCYKHFDQKVF